MKKLLPLVGLLLGASQVYAGCLLFDPQDTGTVLVSTTAAKPTQLFHANAYDQKSELINNTTYYLYLVSDSTSAANYGTASTLTANTSSGSFYIQPLSSLMLDGPMTPFQGDLWGVVQSTSNGLSSPQGISTLRCR